MGLYGQKRRTSGLCRAKDETEQTFCGKPSKDSPVTYRWSNTSCRECLKFKPQRKTKGDAT